MSGYIFITRRTIRTTSHGNIIWHGGFGRPIVHFRTHHPIEKTKDIKTGGFTGITKALKA